MRSLRTVDASVNTVLDPLRLAASVPQAVWKLLRWRPDVVYTTGGYVAIPVLAAALLRSPWRALAHDSAQHVFFGACVAMLMLWTMQVDFGSGLTLHLLGITTVTLMFGWPLALVAVLALVIFAGWYFTVQLPQSRLEAALPGRISTASESPASSVSPTERPTGARM